MTIPFPAKYAKDFDLLVAAAVAGERCPTTQGGPLANDAIAELVRAGAIRSEVYRWNYRVVTILVGPHKGKSTKAPPGKWLKPWMVDGVNLRKADQPQQTTPRTYAEHVAAKRAPPSAPRNLTRGK